MVQYLQQRCFGTADPFQQYISPVHISCQKKTPHDMLSFVN